MSRLNITLLGAFQTELDGEILTSFGTDKARALLAYIATESHRPHQREHLAGLFWSDQPEKRALHSLRQSLSTLRKTLKDVSSDPSFLIVNRDTVQFNPESNYSLDTLDFIESIDQGLPQFRDALTYRSPNIRRLQHAHNLYRGNFLDQMVLKGSPLFDEWAVLQREFLTRKIIEVMSVLVNYYERRGEFDRACKIAEQIVSLVPWEENAHRIIIRMLAKGGQKTAAEVQFQTLRRYLSDELGVSPSPQTLELVETIRQEDRQDWHFEPQYKVPPTNLPNQSTSFFGRKKLLEKLWDILINPDCRLVTLTGPGGIGKSRLALQVSSEMIGIFPDGIFFVPITPVTTINHLPISISEAIGFSFYASQEPLELLINHLRHKNMLLVLDDFEHLQSFSDYSTEILSKLLAHAPNIIILVTSRQSINLRMEQVIEVKGLSYPHKDDFNQPEFSSDGEYTNALQLFKQIARRVSPNFSLRLNIQEVVRVCQLVEGSPLGIELSATWVRGYSVKEIVNLIEEDYDFLTTPMQDVPNRHRSLRSVFNHSWRLLDSDEKSILRKLAVFQGGFTLPAAKIVASVTRTHLYSLTQKSLLHKMENDRFDMPNLVRQFASDMLTRNPSENVKTNNSHCNYYAVSIKKQEAGLHGNNPVFAQKIISQDIENYRASWQWASEQHKIDALFQAAPGLGRFYNMRSWFLEGRDLFSQTAISLQEIPDHDCETLRVLGIVSTQLGWFEVQLGNYQSAISTLNNIIPSLKVCKAQRELAASLNILGSAIYELGELKKAKSLFEESLRIAAIEDFQKETAFSNNYLGSIARNQGDFSQAKQFFTESLKHYHQISDQWGSAKVLNNLGNIAGISGEYAEAENFFTDSLMVRRELNDQAGIASCLQNMSIIAFLEEDYSRAKTLREECLIICQEIGFTWGIASTLKHLGDVDKAIGNLSHAKLRYQESLTISDQSKDRRSVAFTLNSLGSLALQQGEIFQAYDYYTQALKTALDIDVIPLVLDIIMGIGALKIKKGLDNQAVELIIFAKNHPGAENQTRNRGELLLSELESIHDDRIVNKLEDQVSPKSLSEITQEILNDKFEKSSK